VAKRLVLQLKQPLKLRVAKLKKTKKAGNIITSGASLSIRKDGFERFD